MQLKGTSMKFTTQNKLHRYPSSASTGCPIGQPFSGRHSIGKAGLFNRLLPRWLLVLALVLAWSSRLFASEIVIIFAQDKLQGTAKSFEISINGVNHFNINATATGFTVKKRGTKNGGDFRLEVTKDNGTIADGDKIILKISGQDAAKVDPLAPVWSDDKGNVMGTSDKTKTDVHKNKK
jgi:hypothetical protein